ncbi:hypothetical protein KVR01_008675 [Diaporthe batatas]|uniref:uncharacterized protein n=1 Tax=Diaporthe batatas TaxID=748121 RepID=UPI001D03B1B2|nr:uncharacterized protein KVR01_008675 [Diaporthe batatas]KAG8161688.1 hypothetical protein KVR01_008675 [Diaporthe batatas]
MGSVIVEAMSGSTLAAEPKKLHPFFTAPRPRALQQDAITTDPDPTPAASHSVDSADSKETLAKDSDMESPESTARQRKRRKPAEDVEQDVADNKKPRRGRKKNNPQAVSIMNHFIQREGEDLATTPHETRSPDDTTPNEDAVQRPTEPLSSADNEDTTVQAIADQACERREPSVPPKKVLRFNPNTGTLGSPPKPKEPQLGMQQGHNEVPVREKATPTPKGKRRSARLVKVSYGTDDESRNRIGTKIDGILSTAVSPPSKLKKRSTKREQQTTAKAKSEAPQKDTHPFFSGKPQKATATSQSETTAETETKSKPPPSPKRPRIFSSTPCSPKKQRAVGSSKPMPQFGVKSLGLKTPGARAPAWPWKGMLHVRGDDVVSSRQDEAASSIPLLPRKSKGNTIHIPPHEEVLGNFATKLNIPELLDAVKNIDTESFLPPPRELRLPQKHFESGLNLQKRILPELKNAKHDALASLRTSLATSLSAFDRYQCEPISWAQKYAPKAAVEVLQHGKEVFLLRDWLQALKVQSVDTGEPRPKATKGAPPKKKRKKNKTDDFIVDSDEEADEMDEVSDPEEEDWSPDRRGGKRTVIRAGDTHAKDSKGAQRLTNTVVISGPHGCGKTAAVYAIAKELDFEVFEINPGSRRSGKDVFDKIGDMTRNHLVQHQQTEAAASAINDEEVAEDIKSGKQATMASFFKPKPTPKQPSKTKKPAPKGDAEKTEVKKSAPKNQKQSLILLDEIDVLYEEDKNFWSTVIGLIAQSKRPFILTCNDEKLVPFQTLSLHGIFRFSEPPTDLAVDRLLMIAACEGHALRRNAVSALFEARQRDLRACLAELNYWCQIAVGDRRSGVDWYYPRYPKGCDIDEQGNVIRVVSQDTYLEGMGWLAHDVLAEEQGDMAWLEDELLQEAWNNWQMDVGDWQDTLDMPSWASQLEASDRGTRLAALTKYDEFADAMGVADLCSSAMIHAESHHEGIDCTMPEITAKSREDYILGRELLDAPVTSTYDPLATTLPISLKTLARRDLEASYPSPRLQAPDEAALTPKIRLHMSQPPSTGGLTRDDLNLAFDPLAASEKTSASSSSSSSLEASVFDHTLAPIVEDVAPYVRGIVAYDDELQRQRLRMSNLLSKGGGGGGTKRRMRNTRASHAALEGGSRTHTRPDRWFKADLNRVLVMRTAGGGWADAVRDVVAEGAGAGGDGGEPAAGRAKDRARKVVADDGESGDELGGSPGGGSDSMGTP